MMTGTVHNFDEARRDHSDEPDDWHGRFGDAIRALRSIPTTKSSATGLDRPRSNPVWRSAMACKKAM